MKKAAIIVYGNNCNKIMFWVLGKPCEVGKISIELDGETYEILVFEAPYSKENKNKLRQRRIIDKFCGDNNIRFVFYADDEDEDEQLESIYSSIKILCILREIGTITGEDIFNKSFGIVADKLNPVLLEAISEEASSMIILKSELYEHIMEELYNKIMVDKGLSIAFVNDIKFLINQSSVILWNSSTSIERYRNILRDKIVLGNDLSVGIYTKQIDHLQPDTIYMKYKEEIVRTIIKLAANMDIWKIASCFPFLYLLDKQGNPMMKDQIRLSLARSNKTLTIQKC